MKKIALIAALATHFSLQALPLGNPWEASLFCDGQGIFCVDQECCGLINCDKMKMRLGFYGDYVFNRKIEVRKKGNPDLDKTEIFTNAGLINVNVCDRFDFFATLGGTSFHVSSPESSFLHTGNTFNVNLDIRFNTAFSWSVGARGTLYNCGNFGIGSEIQYFFSNPHITSLYAPMDGAQLTTYPIDNLNMRYNELQVGLGISYNICLSDGFNSLPYFGVAWSHARGRFGNAEDRILSLDADGVAQGTGNVKFSDWVNQRYWGFVLGMTLVGSERFNLGIEGRSSSEKALYFNSTIRF